MERPALFARAFFYLAKQNVACEPKAPKDLAREGGDWFCFSPFRRGRGSRALSCLGGGCSLVGAAGFALDFALGSARGFANDKSAGAAPAISPPIMKASKPILQIKGWALKDGRQSSDRRLPCARIRQGFTNVGPLF